ncbi:unnamed protein product [Vitrella brassicaformis CCMP3155]|uniref:DUF6827 domain-containing protein n=1 Tax=Vitrella brassicaformis (strain CCMP3155) TaxID=1169540 RepID=A0A0G4EIH6_VITBC|nr:unnamed protein product [Vitrella brassicaformis CCMP3155]|eukprot:CEL95786.1 unnamed protein product [Vitrella brassicaformis CCMP3155]
MWMDATRVAKRASDFQSMVMASNWQDYFLLVQELPMWEAELERLEAVAEPFGHIEGVGDRMKYISEMMDVLYQVEDVKDHLNEVMEEAGRSTGIAGTGVMSADGVDNIEEHAQAAAKRYEELIAEHPQFKTKIDSVLGVGLAQFRQKYHFEWDKKHEFFY